MRTKKKCPPLKLDSDRKQLSIPLFYNMTLEDYNWFFSSSCHMIDWPPGCHFSKLSFMKMCECSFPDSKPWTASHLFISKSSPFYQVKVQISREFCAAPESLPPPDDELSPPGSETCSLHPMDIHGKDKSLMQRMCSIMAIFLWCFQWNFYVGWEKCDKFSLGLELLAVNHIFILFFEKPLILHK